MIPRVAVLLSTYNGERFLDEQLASLRAQEGVEVLLHVRDDGSTDGTREVLARHADRWPHLACVPGGTNLGPAASFLELLRTAPHDADYYAFCDQDDVWLPGKLGRAVAILEVDRGAALYCSNVTCVDENLGVLGVPRAKGEATFQHLLFENIAYGCTTVMNRPARTAIVTTMPEGGVIMHDWWCALVVAAFGRIHFDPRPSLLYRQHSSSTLGATVWQPLQILIHLRRFIRAMRKFYPVCDQARELHRLFEGRLRPGPARATSRLVATRSSFWARLRLAVSKDVVRASLMEGFAARVLIAMNWH